MQPSATEVIVIREQIMILTPGKRYIIPTILHFDGASKLIGHGVGLYS